MVDRSVRLRAVDLLEVAAHAPRAGDVEVLPVATAVGAAVVACALRWRGRRKKELLRAAFCRDGYVIVKNLLSAPEVARLEEAVTCDGGIQDAFKFNGR